MNSKVINSISVLCLIALIGVMAWRDMNPRIETNNSPTSSVSGYYAGPAITPAMIPDDDNKPVTVDVGDFSYAPDGKMTWMAHGMPATTFAQRQINLQFNFKSLPQDPAQTIEKIQAVVDGWVHKGDIINILVLNYDPVKANLKGYTALLHAAHDKFSKTSALGVNRYVIFASINPQWQDGRPEALKDLQEFSPRFLINLPQASIPPALLAKLADLKYNLILQYPPGTQTEDVDMAVLKKLNSLSGVVLALDPHRPLPKNEEKIGLFPKF